MKCDAVINSNEVKFTSAQGHPGSTISDCQALRKNEKYIATLGVIWLERPP